MRLSTRLPCAWQPVDEPLDYVGLRHQFELPGAVDQQFALEDAAGAVQDTLRELTDNRIRMALHAIDHKIDLVAGMVATGHEPPERDVTLSLHGMDLDSEERVDEGRAVACHLLLDSSYHYLSMGTVSRCTALPEDGLMRWRLGIVFALAHTPASLACEGRLARYLLAHSAR